MRDYPKKNVETKKKCQIQTDTACLTSNIFDKSRLQYAKFNHVTVHAMLKQPT